MSRTRNIILGIVSIVVGARIYRHNQDGDEKEGEEAQAEAGASRRRCPD